MKRAQLLLMLFLSGCGSSPIPDFYTLYPEPGSTSDEVALQIELRRPGLPGYLDRPNIVRRKEAGQLDISGTERWGDDLGQLVGSTVAQNLTQRLPRSTIYNESGVISSDPDMIVEIDLQRFERTDDGLVRLDVQVALHWTGGSGKAVIERYELSAKPEDSDTQSMVAAMSSLLGELSEAITRSITSMASGRGSGGEALEGDTPAAEMPASSS